MAYLRPDFTQTLLARLVNGEGENINLVGGPHQGREHALKDLRDLARKQGYKAYWLDCFQFLGEEGFMRALGQAVGTDPMPFNALLGQASLEVLLRAPAVGSKPVLLLLENFHKVLDNPKQPYSRHFFDGLNALRNQGLARLCIATERSHLTYKLHLKDETVLTTSWLELVHRDLPPLLPSERRALLAKEIARCPHWRPEHEMACLEALEKSAYPLRLLDYITQYFEAPPGRGARVKALLRAWEKKCRQDVLGREKAPTWIKGVLPTLREVSEIWKNFKPNAK